MAGEKGKEKSGEKEGMEISPVVNFVAGGLVSAVSKIMVYPMETKVLLMALGEDAASDPSRMWHGATVKGLENFMYNGLLWQLKEWVRPPAPDPARPDKRPPATFLGAFAASCAAIVLAHPSSNVVVGMQASLKQAQVRSALEVTRDILRQYGPGGFYLGWRLSVVLRVGSALALVIYDAVRPLLAPALGSDLANFVAGLLGRLSEVYLSHPFKTLRSRQQRGQAFLPSWSPAAVLGLWRGVGTMALADAVKIGIRFLLIERLRHFLQWLLVKRLARRRQAHKSRSQMSSAPSFSLAMDAAESGDDCAEESAEVPGAGGHKSQQTLMGA